MNTPLKPIKLIAFDQDDTALLPDGRPSSEGLRAIEEALEQGVVVSSVSGRNIDRSSEPFGGVPTLFDRLYLIANNGGIILGPAKQGKRPLLFEQRLAQDTFRELLDFIEENSFNFVYSWLRITDDIPVDSVITNEYTASIASIEDQSRASGDQDTKLLERLRSGDYPLPPKMLILPGLSRREAVLSDMKARFGSDLYLVKTNPDRIEIMHADVNKRVAVEFITRKHGFSMNQVMAIGDGDNDLPMLFNAGLGVIMGNAQSAVIDKGRSEGLVIAPANHENGFAWAIDNFVLKKEIKK